MFYNWVFKRVFSSCIGLSLGSHASWENFSPNQEMQWKEILLVNNIVYFVLDNNISLSVLTMYLLARNVIFASFKSIIEYLIIIIIITNIYSANILEKN